MDSKSFVCARTNCFPKVGQRNRWLTETEKGKKLDVEKNGQT